MPKRFSRKASNAGVTDVVFPVLVVGAAVRRSLRRGPGVIISSTLYLVGIVAVSVLLSVGPRGAWSSVTRRLHILFIALRMSGRPRQAVRRQLATGRRAVETRCDSH